MSMSNGSASELFARHVSQAAPVAAVGEVCSACLVPMEVSAGANDRTCPHCGAVEERISGELDTDGAIAHLHYEGAGAHWMQKPLERTNPGPTSSPLERILAEFGEFNTRCIMRGDIAPLDPQIIEATARRFVRAIADYARLNAGRALVTRDGARRSLIAACCELVCQRGDVGPAHLPDLSHICAVFETVPREITAGRKILGQLGAADPSFRFPTDRTAMLLDPILERLASGRPAWGVSAYRGAVLDVVREAARLHICYNNIERSRIAGGLAFVLEEAAVGTGARERTAAITAAGGPKPNTVKKCSELYRRFRSRFVDIFAVHGLEAPPA